MCLSPADHRNPILLCIGFVQSYPAHTGTMGLVHGAREFPLGNRHYRPVCRTRLLLALVRLMVCMTSELRKIKPMLRQAIQSPSGQLTV